MGSRLPIVTGDTGIYIRRNQLFFGMLHFREDLLRQAHGIRSFPFGNGKRNGRVS